MTQKRILVISSPDDVHARAVAYVIRAKGHICEELYCVDYPTLATITLKASNHITAPQSVVRYTGEGFNAVNVNDKFDTIWLRRRQIPELPLSMHPGDREVALRQCDRCLSDLIAGLDGPDVFWVNPLECDNTSNLKMYQLRRAERAGLTIPDTLVSNDPDEIREFIARCGGKAIHKLLQNAVWKSKNDEKTFGCYTTPITCDDLPKDAALRLSPGIFQPLLKKQFEARVACFGEYLMALQIDSQSDDRARIDWRAGQRFIDMKPYILPEAIAQGIRRFLRSTRFTFAALDFIVTPDGEHIFLEANPNGQFLWMEDRTEMPVLNVFSDYLIAAHTDFHPQADKPQFTWFQFKEIWNGGLREEARKHVPASSPMSVPDYV